MLMFVYERLQMFKAFLPSGIVRVPIKTQDIKCCLAFS